MMRKLPFLCTFGVLFSTIYWSNGAPSPTVIFWLLLPSIHIAESLVFRWIKLM